MISRSSLLAVRGASKPSLFANNILRATAIASSSSSTSSTFSPQYPLTISRRQVASVNKPSTSQSAEQNTILAAQRRNRPVSPHLEIYNKEHTFFGGSIWERITGLGFTGLLYGYATAYLVAPLLGWHLESASIAAAFGGLPLLAKGGLKFLVAWPFTFHFINGMKHLSYDFALGFSKKQIKLQGWIWWGASLVSALGLVVFL